MADVFISYKRDERKRCEHIAEKLTALGLDVWFDARLEAGVSFDREIERALGKAKAVLVLWSPKSVESQWVRNEASVGKESDKLVAASLEPCTLPVALAHVHHEDLHDPDFQDDNPAWLKIVERIAKLTGRPSIVSYSQALARAALPLEEWARQNPGDPLAGKMRQKANLLGGAEPPVAKPKSALGALLAVGAVCLALGAGLGTFGVSRLVAGPEVADATDAAEPAATPQSEAARLVGKWDDIYSPTETPTCEQYEMEIWLGPNGEQLIVATGAHTLGDAMQPVQVGRQVLGALDADGTLHTSGAQGDQAYRLGAGAGDAPLTVLGGGGGPPLWYGACP